MSRRYTDEALVRCRKIAIGHSREENKTAEEPEPVEGKGEFRS
jgi:hypothetical protein